jgi:hypothetical protein
MKHFHVLGEAEDRAAAVVLGVADARAAGA